MPYIFPHIVVGNGPIKSMCHRCSTPCTVISFKLWGTTASKLIVWQLVQFSLTEIKLLARFLILFCSLRSASAGSCPFCRPPALSPSMIFSTSTLISSSSGPTAAIDGRCLWPSLFEGGMIRHQGSVIKALRNVSNALVHSAFQLVATLFTSFLVRSFFPWILSTRLGGLSFRPLVYIFLGSASVKGALLAARLQLIQLNRADYSLVDTVYSHTGASALFNRAAGEIKTDHIGMHSMVRDR